jgi:hypothetical protein
LIETQLTEKDREFDELHRQLQQAQDEVRARKHITMQLDLYPLTFVLIADALAMFN